MPMPAELFVMLALKGCEWTEISDTKIKKGANATSFCNNYVYNVLLLSFDIVACTYKYIMFN